MDLRLALVVVTVAVVAAAALLDLRKGIIPNALTLPLVVGAPLVHLAARGADGLAFSILGAFGSALIPWVLFRAGAMGGGDVKLFAGVGASLGLASGAEIFTTSLLVGCAQALAVLAWRGHLRRTLRTSWTLLRNGLRAPEQRTAISPEALTDLRLGPAILLATLWTAVVAA